MSSGSLPNPDKESVHYNFPFNISLSVSFLTKPSTYSAPKVSLTQWSGYIVYSFPVSGTTIVSYNSVPGWLLQKLTWFYGCQSRVVTI